MPTMLGEQATQTTSAAEPAGLRERQKQARGEAILAAAFALIVEQGYDALTMEAVAARVGISRQTLYHYFASREDIALRAVLTLMEQGNAAIHAFDALPTPGERLRRVARWMLESRFEPTRAAFVKVRYSLMSIKAHPDYQRALEKRGAALAQVVADAQAAQEIRSDFPPRLVVQMLLGLVSDASYEGVIADGLATSAEIVDAVLDVFFAGLRP